MLYPISTSLHDAFNFNIITFAEHWSSPLHQFSGLTLFKFCCGWNYIVSFYLKLDNCLKFFLHFPKKCYFTYLASWPRLWRKIKYRVKFLSFNIFWLAFGKRDAVVDAARVRPRTALLCERTASQTLKAAGQQWIRYATIESNTDLWLVECWYLRNII